VETAIKLFCSYAHRDESLREELAKHLKLLERQGLVRSWHDRQIGAGDLWKDAIDRNLQEADIILLLISADFLASDYCFDVEMKTALERHAKGEALVIPIILRPVNWHSTQFGKLQALPRDGKPVTTFENVDIALEQVSQGVRKAIELLVESRRGTNERPAIPSPEVTEAPQLSDTSLQLVTKLLTVYIGPIAKVVVRQAAGRCRDVRELCETIADEIADTEQRSRFLHDVRTIEGWTTRSERLPEWDRRSNLGQ
jgi:TIR domain